MIDYKNLSGKSNISRYAIAPSYIDVEFAKAGRDGSTTYRYSYASSGISKVEQMKVLATRGIGLSTFIIAEARTLYEKKW